MVKMWSWLTIVTLVLATAAPVDAQGEQARFAGTVRDQSGAFFGGAKVVAKNERTGEERSVESNDKGYYLVAGLKPAQYTLRAEKAGFAPIEYTGLTLGAGQELTLDLEFRPEGVTQAVTVVGSTPTLDLSSARMGANVSEREVQGLPVNGRQMSQLMLQAPGSQNAGTGTWNDVRFSGRAVEQNVIKYDGIEGSGVIDAAPGVANGENNTPFKLQASLENVQEFRVESSSYPAEFGTGTGGQVSVITKSGANDFHGNVFAYTRHDRFDSRNYFDSLRNADGSVISEGAKSPLKLNQFGGSTGGPIVQNKAFFFGSYEGYRLDAGLNFVEAVPSEAAWSRAAPAVAGLRSGFLAPGAVILPGASSNSDFDIAQNQAAQHVEENAISGRLDLRFTNNWSSYVRVFRDAGTNDEPQGVTGRRFITEITPINAVFNLQGLLGNGMVNELKIGYNAAKSTAFGTTSTLFDGIALNLSGTVANSGIAGQSGNSAVASPGGLVRVNSAGNGRGAPYDPYSLTFADSLSRVAGTHFLKIGADARLIRMTSDQLGGITYTYQNLAGFLANTPSSIQYFGDLSEPSPFHDGASGPRHIAQEYYVAFAQDEWRVNPKLTVNYGLRYDYYAPLRETDNRIVKFNIETGTLDPDTTALYRSKKTNLQPRIGSTYALSSRTVLRGGFGIFVGPGQTEDQIQPIEAERISTTLTSGPLLAYPIDPAAIRLNFTANPNNRSYQPRAYAGDYTLPERVYQYTASVQQELGRGLAATAAYVGSQGRNLFLRSIANRTIGVQSNGASAATQIREFDIVSYGADGRIASIQRPYAEIDYKTSGGRDSYNSMQLALTRRSSRGLVMNAQYTLGYSRGTSGGSNEARTVGNNARDLGDFEYDYGYNNFDVRHTFNLSALYTIPGQGALLGGWSVGGILNARSGVPINLLITRPDIVYRDGAGTVWNAPAADRTAVINTPGGGASRSTRRPDVVPGVSPFIKDGGLLYLNPAAFSTPKPGTFGNMERNSVHGPNFRQLDVVVAKRLDLGRGPNVELRAEVFNVFNTTNFNQDGIAATLPNALPGAGESSTQANRVQPGQPFTATNAGTFGRATSTVGRTVGLGTNRQVQLAVRVGF
ncbi:MAG: TonB-dependent receptor [Vicinamibacterales bacterium]